VGLNVVTSTILANIEDTSIIVNPSMFEQANEGVLQYKNYGRHEGVRKMFEKFTGNSYGYAWSVCDRLWFQNDLSPISPHYTDIINNILPNVDVNEVVVCLTCKKSFDKKNPMMSTFNGFKYPEIPPDLPPLNIITETYLYLFYTQITISYMLFTLS
jgi:hypothetical protein